ncbi:MAG: YggT family protein [Anaerolineae bacterium]|nr:YggT family protein [Anaerolineae bacterium]
MYTVIRLVQTLFSLYSICLIARTFLDMLLGPSHAAVVFLRRITEPVLAPIRRYIPPVRSGAMAWDLSPVVALILLWLVERVLLVILTSLA